MFSYVKNVPSAQKVWSHYILIKIKYCRYYAHISTNINEIVVDSNGAPSQSDAHKKWNIMLLTQSWSTKLYKLVYEI